MSSARSEDRPAGEREEIVASPQQTRHDFVATLAPWVGEVGSSRTAVRSVGEAGLQ
jgi:hypothetical protein